jgi:hypothetical protein
MKNENEKKYEHNGKTIKIIPAKRVKKMEASSDTEDETGKSAPVSRKKKAETEKGVAKFSVNDKVSLKNIPPEYAGYGFAESTVIKVFKSTSENEYRYSIKSSTGQEMALLKENQLKVRKVNFKK